MATSSSGPSAASASETQHAFSYRDATEDEILEDLTSRFILNLPDEELTSLERICFQVEQAHWYYEDFIREENPRMPSLALRKFTTMMFTHCPILQHWNHEEAFDKFMKYKTKVPVCGAIMLNDTWDKCVLVKGWKSSSGWGFPKGKINETEERYLCAVREVLEETGYNLASQINPDHYLETVNNGQVVTLFIVPNVPEDYPFRTKTRKEISKIEWFRLIDLPGWRRAKQAPGKFYLIAPFIQSLKAFVNNNKPTKKPRKAGAASKSSPTQAKVPATTLQPIPQESDGLHDSSSQSSSLDNGDPLTPSPQYTESTPAFVPEIADEQSEPRIPIESLDPQLARLLSGLSMSAANPSKGPEVQDSALQHHPGVVQVAPPESSVPATSSIPGLAAHSSSEPTAQQANQVVQPIVQNQNLSADSSQRAERKEYVAVMPISPSPASSCANMAITPRSPNVRKSSIADISPYLSRPPVEVPLSARRLQQLALLEAVADESARMTPLLSAPHHHAPSQIPSQIPNGPGLSPLLHQPMPSQPPVHQPNHLNPGHLANASFTGNVGRPGPPQDQFARSRTSQGLHRMGQHGPLGSMSMNQHQLLSLINGGVTYGQPPPPPPHPLPAQVQMQPPMPYPNTFSPQATYPGPKSFAQFVPGVPPPLPHVQEHGGLQYGFAPRPRPYSTAPMSAMAPMPPFATKPPQPSTANALLSLLTSGPTPTGAPNSTS